MKAYAIVLACWGSALAATSFIERISMWGPLVFLCLLMAVVTVWVIRAEGENTPTDVSFKKAA